MGKCERGEKSQSLVGFYNRQLFLLRFPISVSSQRNFGFLSSLSFSFSLSHCLSLLSTCQHFQIVCKTLECFSLFLSLSVRIPISIFARIITNLTFSVSYSLSNFSLSFSTSLIFPRFISLSSSLSVFLFFFTLARKKIFSSASAVPLCRHTLAEGPLLSFRD